MQAMLVAVNEYLTRERVSEPLSFLNGKPMPLNRHTRDKEARKGYGHPAFERGYKIHAWVPSDGAIPCLAGRPLKEGGPKVARGLVHHVGERSLAAADANDDSAPLYEAVRQNGAQLLTPLKGMSERPDPWRRMSYGHHVVIGWWRRMPPFCQSLLRVRIAVERAFSVLTCLGGGLTTLPPWVRTLHRVTS